MDILTALGLSVPAGLNAYIPLLAVALAQRVHWLELRPPFDVLGSWWLITIIAVLLVVEIVADKIPAVDHVNDIIQSVVRPAAGAVVAGSGGGHSAGPLWAGTAKAASIVPSMACPPVRSGGALRATAGRCNALRRPPSPGGEGQRSMCRPPYTRRQAVRLAGQPAHLQGDR